VVRCNPLLFQSLEDKTRLFDLPYRIIFAIATLDSISIYDTEHIHPLLVISNTHLEPITDMAWAYNGYVLAISSRDGYCSFVGFTENDLGKPTGQQITLDLSTHTKTQMSASKGASQSKKPKKS